MHFVRAWPLFFLQFLRAVARGCEAAIAGAGDDGVGVGVGGTYGGT